MSTDDDAPDVGQGAWTLLAEALAPTPPPAELRGALLSTLAGAARYLPFTPSMCRVFDVDRSTARALLQRAAGPSQWQRGKPPFARHMDFTGGAACAGLRAGFVVMDANATIPGHRHTDREVTLVLEGAIQSGGQTYGPGAVLEMPVGSEHVFEVSAQGAVFAVLRGRVAFLG